MPDFKNFQWGRGLTAAGFAFQLLFAVGWLFPPTRPEHLELMTYIGIFSVSIALLGVLILFCFNAKGIQEDFTKEKLLADFTRNLYYAPNLRDDVTGPFLVDRILNEIKHRPNEYLAFIQGLTAGARQVLAQHCAKEDARLQGELERALKDSDANTAYAAASHVVAQKEDWGHLKRLVEFV